MPSDSLPSERARPGDYRPESTGRLSQARVDRRRDLDVARDREYLERIDTDEARRFARENPDAGREDFLRSQGSGVRLNRRGQSYRAGSTRE